MDPWSDDWNDDHDGFHPGDAVGRYELLYAAASGGMATVWAARKKGAYGTDQVLAVKLVSDSLHADQDVRAMFLEDVLNQFYQAGLIAKVDYADVLVFCAPWMLLLGLGMSGITAYATLRAYIRR